MYGRVKDEGKMAMLLERNASLEGGSEKMWKECTLHSLHMRIRLNT